MKRLLTVLLGATCVLGAAQVASAKVLRVGTYHGIKGQYSSIQAAVKAAKPGDWILVAPGDYKTSSKQNQTPAGSNAPAAILITKKNLTLRGMNRNTVIVDGTKPGSPKCSAKKSDQNFGPNGSGGPQGLNGIMVWKADNVSVENLTACNFLGGHGSAGNEIWWNGGANTYGDTGGIGGWGFTGSYLNATSTYFDTATEETAAQYGIFSSDWNGGTWIHTYASNFNDSGYYIGACQQQCNQIINDAWAEFSALGYSGSNSGGRLLIEHSQFDNNEDGFDTNSQNGDNPPPQNGACPAGVKSWVKGAPSCWVFMDNKVHDNNNPNVPAAGAAASGPVGTGMSISGGRNDTVMDNTFSNNKAWGVILVPFLDSGPPCTGGTMNSLGAGSCLFDDWGDAVLNNKFRSNGGYGHPTNGDIAWLNFESGHPTPCFHGNVELGGSTVTTSPSGLQQSHPKCDGSSVPANGNGTFLAEVLCDSQVELSPGVPSACPTGQYPRRQLDKVVMHPLPTSKLSTMPNPCKGVPANPWCPGRHHGHHHANRRLVGGWAVDVAELI